MDIFPLPHSAKVTVIARSSKMVRPLSEIQSPLKHLEAEMSETRFQKSFQGSRKFPHPTSCTERNGNWALSAKKSELLCHRLLNIIISNKNVNMLDAILKCTLKSLP